MRESVSKGSGDSPSSGRQRLQLQGEQQTLAIPLYAKALDFRSKHPILNDRRASEIVDQLDFDFGAISPRLGHLLVIRARQLDEWIREFLGRESDAVVLNLGCGLDSRIARIAPPSTVAWFDIDFPEVIELRRAFFAEGKGYRMIGASITQPEWLEEIPRHRSVIAVADGVLVYIAPDEVKALLNRVTDNLHHGQLVFDVMNTRIIRRANERIHARTGATLRWGVDDLREIVALDPKLRLTGEFSLLGPGFVPLRYKFLNAISILLPGLRNAIRMVRFDF